MKTVAIINSHASRARGNLRSVKKLLESKKLNCSKYIIVDDVKEIEKHYRTLHKLKPGLVIIGGGDGTLISTMEWFYNQGYKGSFGILPLGTANYLARNLEIPLRPARAIDKIINGKPKVIKLARANNKIFSFMATIGFLTQISQNVKVSNKRRLGQLAYITEGIRQLKTHQDFDYEISLNGRKLKGRAFQIAVFNGDINRQVHIAPGSDLKENTLRLVIYKAEKRLFVVLANVLLYILTVGKFRRGMDSFKAKKIEIKASPDKEVSVDGEVNTKTPLLLSASTEKIKVII